MKDRGKMLSFAQKISEVRKAKKIKQYEIAKAVGVNQSAITKYEAGDVVPSVEVANKIAKALGLTLTYLLDGSDEYRELMKDQELLKRVKDLQKLEKEERKHTLFLIDAILRDSKARGLMKKIYEEEKV